MFEPELFAQPLVRSGGEEVNYQWWRQSEIVTDTHRVVEHANDTRERSPSGHGSDLSMAEGGPKLSKASPVRTTLLALVP